MSLMPILLTDFILTPIEASVDHLHLVSGLVYYVTVRACNSADLCTTVTSDGILIDESPPASGQVYDGPSGQDKRFQASR